MLNALLSLVHPIGAMKKVSSILAATETLLDHFEVDKLNDPTHNSRNAAIDAVVELLLSQKKLA